MTRARIRIPSLAALALLLVAAGPLAPAQAKKGGSKTFSQTITPNAAIPDDPGAATPTSTPLNSTITVPKKYKGKEVADVNVTGITTTGTAPSAASQLFAYLTGPSGRTVQLWVTLGDQNLGPWTIDDDTLTSICPVPTPCVDSTQTLHPPFAGTANLVYNFAGGFPPGGGPLATYDGQRMRGTWTLSLADLAPGLTSTLNSWGLRIKPAKPITD